MRYIREDPRLWAELAFEYSSSLKLEVGPYLLLGPIPSLNAFDVKANLL